MSSPETEVERLRRRLEREHRTRLEAERIAEQTTSHLYDRQRELELLQAVATAANEASNLEEVLRATIDGICAHIRWPAGHAYISTPPDGQLVSSGIWHLDDPARFERLRRVSAARVFAPGEGLPGLTVETGAPVWIENVMEDERFPRRATLAAGTVQTALGFPVLVGAQAVAMVELFTDRAIKRDDDVLALVGQIGTQLGRVAERMRARDQIAHQALHDPLTGLPNRALLLDRLRSALARSARSPSLTGVLFIDFDRFKVVNDSLGHAQGDRLLVEAGGRLDQALRPGDTVARLGGDEFVVLCEELEQESEALRLAERLHLALLAPFALDGEDQHLMTASIGVALARVGEVDAEAVLQNADAAMYRAKGLGGGRHELFDETMRDRVFERLRTERTLHHAIDHDQLRLHYQPMVSLEDRSRHGVEALVRWQDPDRGLVPPAQFIPLAEESGLILQIGNWVLREACRQGARWRAELGSEAPLPVNVNLAARQLAQDDLAETIALALADAGLDPRDLSVEITETALLECADTPARTLAALRELGVQVLLDDFGTGYSSLSYLRQFPVDVLKIDRSFIAELGERPEASAIVEAIVGMGHALGLDVLAEGIETEDQAREVARLGCDLGQGYLFAKPAPADAMNGAPPSTRRSPSRSPIR